MFWQSIQMIRQIRTLTGLLITFSPISYSYITNYSSIFPLCTVTFLTLHFLLFGCLCCRWHGQFMTLLCHHTANGEQPDRLNSSPQGPTDLKTSPTRALSIGTTLLCATRVNRTTCQTTRTEAHTQGNAAALAHDTSKKVGTERGV